MIPLRAILSFLKLRCLIPLALGSAVAFYVNTFLVEVRTSFEEARRLGLPQMQPENPKHSSLP